MRARTTTLAAAGIGLALAQTRATSAEVKAPAEQIEAAQDPEIARMSGWLDAWGAPMAMPCGDDAEDLAANEESWADLRAGALPVFDGSG